MQIRFYTIRREINTVETAIIHASFYVIFYRFKVYFFLSVLTISSFEKNITIYNNGTERVRTQIRIYTGENLGVDFFSTKPCCPYDTEEIPSKNYSIYRVTINYNLTLSTERETTVFL